MRLAAHVAAAWLAVMAATVQASAGVEILQPPAPVTGIIAAPSGTFIQTATGFFRITECSGNPCFKPERPSGLPDGAPPGGLVDGKVASARSGDLRHAWYAAPTGRYGHGVLGDAIEGGSLVAEDAAGKQYRFDLPQSHVFEDITPRIADLDGDGANEIVTIRSSLTMGAAVAIYGLAGGRLTLKAVSREIGQSRRWLNVAGISNFFGSRQPIIAWVETPHIGGILYFAAFKGGKLTLIRPPQRGFSNHFIGSRELDLSAAGDFDGDGKTDLFLPSADRAALRLVGSAGNAAIPLPGKVSTAIAPFDGGVVTATADGVLMHVRR